MNTPKKILVVEDERLSRMLLVKVLSSKGYESVPAVDGQHGLELAMEQDFDAIITDLEMPRLGGLEMIRILREKWGYDRPILVTSGYDDTIHRSHFAQLHLLKPLDLQLLFSGLEKLLNEA